MLFSSSSSFYCIMYWLQGHVFDCSDERVHGNTKRLYSMFLIVHRDNGECLESERGGWVEWLLIWCLIVTYLFFHRDFGYDLMQKLILSLENTASPEAVASVRAHPIPKTHIVCNIVSGYVLDNSSKYKI